LLGIETSATPDDVKKAYKEKIKYYHPDKYNDNPVLQKVATDKTRQVVESYKLLCDFLEV
ncbi:MAG: DnaJ domain-containing protein, partial [Treponema sp.]|nr:DnaJ domain-containing protein [Treponema sp.]